MEQITGMIDRLERRKIAGWAYNPINVHEPVQVELCVNGVSHATTTANLPRADLERKGVGTGRHAFSFDLANALTEDELASVAVKAVNTENLLQARGDPDREAARQRRPTRSDRTRRVQERFRWIVDRSTGRCRSDGRKAPLG